MEIKNIESLKKVLKGPVIILIHAHWCGHCRNMMPEWKRFEQEIPKSCKVKVAKIEDSVYSNVKHEVDLGAEGFPTIKLFNNGKLVKKYDGERTSSDMIQFVQSHEKKIAKSKSKAKAKSTSSTKSTQKLSKQTSKK